MALMLKKRGYTDLTIYEKTDRVGGKSYDINYRGAPNVMGTVFLEPSYFDNFVPLAREYGADLVPLPAANPWFSNSHEGRGARAQYYVGEMAAFTNTTDVRTNIGFLLNNVIRYLSLHKELFGDYEGDFMEKPKPSIMNRIRGTFLDFLQRENLEPMKVILKTSHEVGGYGFIDEVSALYGLILNKPAFISTYAFLLLRIPPENERQGFHFLREGFEKVWKNIVEKEELKIEFNTDIYSVKRHGNGNSILKIWEGSSLRSELCNFVIWTPPMPGLLRAFSDVSQEELRLLKGLKPSFLTTSLVNMEAETRNGPFSFYLPNMNSSTAEEGGVMVEFSQLGSLRPDIATPDGEQAFNNQTLKTSSIFQMSSEHMSEKVLRSKLRNHYEAGLGAKNLEILHSISWDYFYRWSPEEMEAGRLWDVFRMQGSRGIWYSGASVSHESIRSVMEYNKLLVRNMVPRIQKTQHYGRHFYPYTYFNQG